MSARNSVEHISRVQAGRARYNAQRNANRLEDVRWMAETGESLTGAARRLGITRDALEQWCRRFAPDVGRTLRDREPRDPNQRPGIEAMRGKRWAS